MAIVNTSREIIDIFEGIGGLFGGGGSGKDRRRRKREQLQKQGFTLIENGPSYNMDDWGDQALDNLATLYSQYGDVAVQLHNNRKIASDSVARNYATLEQMAISQKEENQSFFGSGNKASQAINAGTGVLTALAIAGGLLWFIGRG